MGIFEREGTMNYYQSLLQRKEDSMPEKAVEDATVSGLKSVLAESFPTRIKSARDLIAYVPYTEAKRIIEEGVALIKSIPSKEDHKRISAYLLQVFLGNRTVEQFAAYLMRVWELDQAHAEMIVEDQINKAGVRFLIEKWKKSGCKKVRWIHKGMSNPRQYHLRKWNGVSGKRSGKPNGLNGFVFSIDNPPVIDKKTQARGLPGHMINCKCTLEPVWD